MKVLLIIFACCLTGCVSALDPVVYPDIASEWRTLGIKSLVTKQKDVVTGIYAVEVGNSYFGDTVALRYDGDRVALYSATNVVFVSGYVGIQDSAARMLAAYRSVTGSLVGILDVISVGGDAVKDVINGAGQGRDLTFDGALQVNGQSIPVRFSKKGLINTRLRGFSIIAHRGGGRNSERLGYSENSIEMMRFASRLGASAIEIDVQMTRDSIPIIFHDPTFTSRTVQSSYIIGPVENYTLAQMRSATRLVYGEQIPTLREVLQTVIDSTNLTIVWLDVKQTKVIDSILIIAKEMNDYAKGKRNKFEVLFGIPEEAVLNRYLESPFAGTVPVLCELDIDAVRKVNASVWAPRFTAGIQSETVMRMQAEGRRVFVWTLDDEAFVRKYLEADVFDGILTNYPTMLAAIFYTRGLRF